MVTNTSHSDEAYDALIAARALVDRRRKALASAQAAFDGAVARAVSAEPESIAWYDAPGYLSRSRVMEAAGLGTMQLHRLMERFRTAHPPKRARRRRARVAS
jgi:hypothetical protein